MLSLTLAVALVVAPEPPEPTSWSPNASRRYAGALLGAIAGAALPLAFMPVADRSCPAPCLSPAHVVLLATSTVLGGVGLTLGHGLGDGTAPSFGAAAVGAVLGGLVSLVWVGTVSRTPIGAAPESASISVTAIIPITIAAQLMALEIRYAALESKPTHVVPWTRFGGAVGAGALAFLGGALTGLLLGALFLPSNPTVFLPLGLALGVPLAPLTVAVTHRALGGRGSVGAAYLGLLVSGAIAAAAVLAATFASGATGFPTVLGTSQALALAAIGTVALAGPAIAVEWSHARQVDEDGGRPAEVELSFAPMPSGGAAVLVGRW